MNTPLNNIDIQSPIIPTDSSQGTINAFQNNFPLYFFSIMLPALLCLLAAMVFMALRTFKINQIAKEKPLKEQEYNHCYYL